MLITAKELSLVKPLSEEKIISQILERYSEQLYKIASTGRKHCSLQATSYDNTNSLLLQKLEEAGYVCELKTIKNGLRTKTVISVGW